MKWVWFSIFLGGKDSEDSSPMGFGLLSFCKGILLEGLPIPIHKGLMPGTTSTDTGLGIAD